MLHRQQQLTSAARYVSDCIETENLLQYALVHDVHKVAMERRCKALALLNQHGLTKVLRHCVYRWYTEQNNEKKPQITAYLNFSLVISRSCFCNRNYLLIMLAYIVHSTKNLWYLEKLTSSTKHVMTVDQTHFMTLYHLYDFGARQFKKYSNCHYSYHFQFRNLLTLWKF